jgi:CelD/BcsL family acetyltransferase involved in cellulose biosynthesis
MHRQRIWLRAHCRISTKRLSGVDLAALVQEHEAAWADLWAHITATDSARVRCGFTVRWFHGREGYIANVTTTAFVAVVNPT